MIYSTTATVAGYAFSEDRQSYRLSLKAKEWDGSFLPGQFVNVRVPAHSERHKYKVYPNQEDFFAVPHEPTKRFPYIRRPFSIYRTESDTKTGEATLHLLIAKLGIGSTQLGDLRVGEELDLLAPIGNGFPIRKDVSEVYLVGGGIGIAPLIETSRQYRELGIKTTILYGVRKTSSSLIVSKEDIGDAADEFLIATDVKEEGAYNGYVTDLLVERKLSAPDFSPAGKLVLSCGPKPMFDTLAKILFQYNVEGYFSLETAMACGIGSCMGCVVKVSEGGDSCFRRTCQEGPVFSYRELYTNNANP